MQLGTRPTVIVRNVTVVDTAPPVISLKGEVLVTHEAGSSYKDGGASATDVVDGDLSVDDGCGEHGKYGQTGGLHGELWSE